MVHESSDILTLPHAEWQSHETTHAVESGNMGEEVEMEEFIQVIQQDLGDKREKLTEECQGWGPFQCGWGR